MCQREENNKKRILNESLKISPKDVITVKRDQCYEKAEKADLIRKDDKK